MANVFDAGEIIGKTLIPKVNYGLKKSPTDLSPIYLEWEAGMGLVVDSYLTPKPGRSSIYWVFKNPDETDPAKFLYAPHKTGIFDVKAIQQQGVKTLKEQFEEKQAAEMSLSDKIFKTVTNVAILGGLVILGKTLLERKK